MTTDSNIAQMFQAAYNVTAIEFANSPIETRLPESALPRGADMVAYVALGRLLSAEDCDDECRDDLLTMFKAQGWDRGYTANKAETADAEATDADIEAEATG